MYIHNSSTYNKLRICTETIRLLTHFMNCLKATSRVLIVRANKKMRRPIGNHINHLGYSKPNQAKPARTGRTGSLSINFTKPYTSYLNIASFVQTSKFNESVRSFRSVSKSDMLEMNVRYQIDIVVWLTPAIQREDIQGTTKVSKHKMSRPLQLTRRYLT